MAKPPSKSSDNEPKSQVKISKGPPKSKKVKPWVSVLAGMLAGITEACSLQPLDVAKTRLQLDHGGKYKGMIDCVRTIVREEGVAALYKGLTPFVTHLTVKYALRFGSYSFFKRQLGVVPGSPNEAIGNFTAGLLSGLTEAVLIVTPFETVKIRLRENLQKQT